MGDKTPSNRYQVASDKGYQKEVQPETYGAWGREWAQVSGRGRWVGGNQDYFLEERASKQVVRQGWAFQQKCVQAGWGWSGQFGELGWEYEVCGWLGRRGGRD